MADFVIINKNTISEHINEIIDKLVELIDELPPGNIVIEQIQSMIVTLTDIAHPSTAITEPVYPPPFIVRRHMYNNNWYTPYNSLESYNSAVD